MFTHLDEITPLRLGNGTGVWLVWGWDEVPALPHHDADPFVPRSLFPPPGGLRIWAGGPLAQGDSEAEEDRAELARLIDAEPHGRYDEPTRPGMHRTDSIDIGVVISGEITTEADDGSTVVLGLGGVYIQNGALHNWQSNPENPAHIVFILVGARRAESVDDEHTS